MVSLFCAPPGSFYSYYEHYNYTYVCCGIILLVSSVLLFVGMGINYRLLDRERKEEERRDREEPKGEREAMLAPASPSKSIEGATENSTPAAVTLAEVAKMDEDTV